MNYELAENKVKPLTVTQLTSMVKNHLERQFPRIWMVGELSNFKRAGSGHWYFSLKDTHSQIRCNMWRSAANAIKFQPKDGMELLVSGSLNVYAPRGEYSLVVTRMEEIGVGRLKAQFEQLKRKLHAEGLFDPAHKKPLPMLPRKIGVVTSPTGAAIRDILRILSGRFAGVHVLIYPARVQGMGAASEIARGIAYLDRYAQCDLIITGRGGGSEEDLWCFNEEVVARAVFAAKTPMISAVGHEIDFTICDFVADVRAATPSNAAELAVKSRLEYFQTIHLLQKTMERAIQRKMLHLKNRVHISKSHPIFIQVRSRLNDAQRKLVELENYLTRRLKDLLHHREMRLFQAQRHMDPAHLQNRVDLLRQRLRSYGQCLDHLQARVTFLQQRLNHQSQNLEHKIMAHLDRARSDYAHLVSRLDDLSPLRILNRGYAVAYSPKGKALTHPNDATFGEVLSLRLAHGEICVRVIDRQPGAIQTNLFDDD